MEGWLTASSPLSLVFISRWLVLFLALWAVSSLFSSVSCLPLCLALSPSCSLSLTLTFFLSLSKRARYWQLALVTSFPLSWQWSSACHLVTKGLAGAQWVRLASREPPRTSWGTILRAVTRGPCCSLTWLHCDRDHREQTYWEPAAVTTDECTYMQAVNKRVYLKQFTVQWWYKSWRSVGLCLRLKSMKLSEL